MISLTQNIVKVLPKASSSISIRVTEESLTFRKFFLSWLTFTVFRFMQ